MTSDGRCWADVTDSAASASSSASGVARPRQPATSACAVSHALLWRSTARSAAARPSRARPSAMRASPRGPGQLRRHGRLAGPTLCLFDGSRRDDAGARTHAPARGGEPVPIGGDHHQVVTGQRQIDRLFPPIDAHGVPDSESSTDSATAPPRRPRTWRRAGSALLPGGSAGPPSCPGRAPAAAPVAPRSRRRGQRGPGRAAPVHHHRSHPGTGGRLEGGVPALVDLDQVDQRAHDPFHLAQRFAPPAPCSSARARSSASARAAPVAGVGRLVGRGLGQLGALRGGLELAAGRPGLRPGPAWPGPDPPPRWPAGRPAPPHRRSPLRGWPPGTPGCRCPPARGPPTDAQVHAGPAPGQRLLGVRGPGQDGRPTDLEGLAGLLGAATACASSARSGAPPASSSDSAACRSACSRAPSASSVETTSSSAAASRAAATPRPRSRSTPERPHARSTSPWTRPRALARSSSRRDGARPSWRWSRPRVARARRAAPAPRGGTRPGWRWGACRRAVRSANSLPAR